MWHCGLHRLDTDKRMEASKAAMSSLHARLQEQGLLQPIDLQFAHLSHFNHRVST